MKLLWPLLAMSVLIPFPTLAESPDRDDSACGGITAVAEAAMKGRQAGMKMQDMMRIVGDGGPAGIFKSIVVMAYEKPRYSSKAYRERAVTDFTNKVYLECYKTLGDEGIHAPSSSKAEPPSDVGEFREEAEAFATSQKCAFEVEFIDQSAGSETFVAHCTSGKDLLMQCTTEGCSAL